MAGQYLDVLVQARGEFSIEDALRVAAFKTSKYTVEGPLHIGAAAALAGPDVFAALTAYGSAIGEAFQLRDDVLGVFGDPARTGKPAGDDLREGKRTLLVALAMQASSAVEAELLKHELGDRSMDDAGVAALREVIVSTGALDQVEQRIAQRTDEARAALRTDAINAEAREALDTLATAATERTG
jgi:geranylgeranyl diphosphate synthase type I